MLSSTSESPGTASRLGVATVALLSLTTWALSHRYRGIIHDAGLYALQALAHLEPGSVSEDVFLKFGSQDRLTVFGPIDAAVSRLLGIESAAAALTLLFQAGLLAGAYGLARTLMPASMALLGVALLIAVPGGYGADGIFTCLEPFLTPRMAAEALVLAGLATALRAHALPAALLMLAAASIHPLMAMAGVAALTSLSLALPKPRLTLALSLVGVALLVAVAKAMPAGQWGRFDAKWLALVEHRSPYLFLRSWQLDDLAPVTVSIVTLTLGVRVLSNERARNLAKITVITTLTGLALTLIACDLLHLVTFTQLQPWRWQWLGTLVAALLLPQILRTLWAYDGVERTTALLLVAAWLFAANAYAVVAAVAALLSLAWLHRLKSGEARWVAWGACGLLAIAALWRVASNLEFTEAYYLDAQIPLWLRRAISFSRDGSVPAGVVALAWWLALERRRRPASIVLAVLAGAACAAVLPQTWSAWTVRDYSSQRFAQFAALRARIPPTAEVFWPEAPVAVWLLLDRPSYLSVLQTSGMVFSRRTATELERRATALSAVVSAASFLGWSGGTGINLTREQLERTCNIGAFDYLVTGTDLGVEPVAAVPSASGAATKKKIRLYRCGAHGG